MDSLEVSLKLGLSLTRGECLAVIKRERGFIESHIKQMKNDRETTFERMKEKIHLLQAYTSLIDCYERDLNQE